MFGENGYDAAWCLPSTQSRKPFKMKLIIAEKPSVGMEIARALGCHTRIEGALMGGGFLVSWAAGHLVELQSPEEYDCGWTWKNASWTTLPMIPTQYALKVSDSGKRQFAILSKLLARADVTSVINACDAGREGELIFDYIYRCAGSKLPIERLWTSAALTQEAILREFQRLKPGQDFMGLRYAARARAAADWLVGMNGTRAVTLAAKGTLFTIGRVQTPTLAFLVAREKQIRTFVPEPFTTILVQFEPHGAVSFVARYETTIEGGQRFHQIKDTGVAQEIVAAITHPLAVFAVSDVTERKKTDKPPLLFNLTTLQKDANRAFGFSAERTLSIAQSLYERHKAISYPRTDSRHLPEDMRGELEPSFEALEAQGYPKEAIERARKRRTQSNNRIFDDAKVTDHHALLPTRVVPKALSADEARIYKMIALRLIVVFQDDLITSVTDVAVALKGSSHRFFAQGKVVLQPGWTRLEKPIVVDNNHKQEKNFKDDKHDGEEKIQTLPRVDKGESVLMVGHVAKQDVTKPPKRYTEADLLALMENAGNRLDETSEREVLRGRGIGTSATRANIIQALIKRDYVALQGKILEPTEKAMVLIENFRAEALKSASMTAQWEVDLVAMERGELRPAVFAEKLNAFVRELVAGAKISTFQLTVTQKKRSTEPQKKRSTGLRAPHVKWAKRATKKKGAPPPPRP